MDSIDVRNSIDTMKFSSFVDDYMYDDDFCDMCDEVHARLCVGYGWLSRYSC